MTITLINPVDFGHGTSREPSSADIDRVMGVDPEADTDFTRDNFTPMKRDDTWESPIVTARRKSANRSPVDPYLPGRLRAEIVLDAPGAPQDVLDAQSAAHAAIARLETAGDAVGAVAQDRADELAKHEAAVATAWREQTKAPRPPRTDWDGEAVTRKLQYGTAREDALASVREFGRVRDGAQQAWLASLTDLIPEALEDARAAVDAAVKALTHHRATVDAAHQLAIATGAFGVNWHENPKRVNVVANMANLAGLRELVSPDNPVVTGEHLTRTDEDAQLNPPAWTRAAIERRSELRPGGEDTFLLAEIREADARNEVAACAKGKRLSAPGFVPAERGIF